MNLRKYLSKKVSIIDIDDKKWIGNVVAFEGANDNDEGEDCISISTPVFSAGWIEFMESEIKSIEVVD